MNTLDFTTSILTELKETLARVEDEKVEQAVESILNAKKALVAGGGRSGFMGKSFVMRLMHMGLDAYIVGETVTPDLKADDVFIVGSGSGETQSLVAMTQKARAIGATIVAVTTNPESTIATCADISIVIPAQAKAESGTGKSIQPMGSLFEQSLLLLYDGMILSIMNKQGLRADVMYGRHANLE